MISLRHRLCFVVAGTALSASGVVVVACSSDNSSSSGALPTPDGGTGPGQSSGNLPDGSAGGNLDGGGGDADCSKAPRLHSDDGGAIFCPFRPKLADGGSAPDCTTTEICCNPGDFTSGPDSGSFAPSYCADDPTKGTSDNGDTACTTGAATQVPPSEYPGSGFATDWECTDKTSCATGVCCLVKDPTADAGVDIGKCTANTCKPADIPVACGALQGFNYVGTRCKASCAAGTDLQLCGESDPCSAGTCTAFRVIGSRDLAYCKP